MRNIYVGRNRILLNLVCITVAWILVLMVGARIQTYSAEGISDIRARSEDGSILLTWKAAPKTWNGCIELVIDGESYSEVIKLDADETSFEFYEGQHGELYTFQVTLKDYDENIIEGGSTSALFLNYAQLPDLPIIRIETKNGILPTFKSVSPPEGSFGLTIDDNEYVQSRFFLEEKGRILTQGTAGLRIRGNTSAHGFSGKPYKLKLDQRLDLLERTEGRFADNEWILLPSQMSLNLEVGTKVAQLVGLEWQPQYRLVNLMINDDWQGCYYLIESVKRGDGRIDIEYDGFIIEDDAYWWNAGDNYFKTELQMEFMGYTFKYPLEEKLTQEMIERVENYINSYEQALLDGKGAFIEYIDVDSVASWLLTHDILGTLDGGSNVYLYINSLPNVYDKENKLKMGPIWDLDSIFMREGKWSRVHGFDNYRILFEQDEFKKAYQAKWDFISETLYSELNEYLEEYLLIYGNALEESWNLHANRWKTEYCTIESTLFMIEEWFRLRTEWLNESMNNL